MKYLVGLVPFIINLFVIPDAGPVAILFIPGTLILGLVIIAAWSNEEMKDDIPDSPEYYKHKQDRDTAIFGAISGTIYGLKKGKDTIKDIADVDHWEKF